MMKNNTKRCKLFETIQAFCIMLGIMCFQIAVVSIDSASCYSISYESALLIVAISLLVLLLLTTIYFKLEIKVKELK